MAEHYGVLIDPCRTGKPKDNAYATDCTSCVGWATGTLSWRLCTALDASRAFARCAA